MSRWTIFRGIAEGYKQTAKRAKEEHGCLPSFEGGLLRAYRGLTSTLFFGDIAD